MRKRPELAAKELLKALAEDPDDAYVHSLLGECMLDFGDMEGAYAEAATTLRLEADSPNGFALLSALPLPREALHGGRSCDRGGD